MVPTRCVICHENTKTRNWSVAYFLETLDPGRRGGVASLRIGREPKEISMNRREFMTNTLMAGVGASMARSSTTGFAAQTRPNDRTTVGLIGSGARGQDLLQSAAKLPGVEFVAVNDAYQGRMTRARARTN